MAHRFVVMVAGELRTYSEFGDIPQDIEHVIEFAPEVPPPPHTDVEHEELHQWALRFEELMEREYRCQQQPEKATPT